jgi:hypothetical protein
MSNLVHIDRGRAIERMKQDAYVKRAQETKNIGAWRVTIGFREDDETRKHFAEGIYIVTLQLRDPLHVADSVWSEMLTIAELAGAPRGSLMTPIESTPHENPFHFAWRKSGKPLTGAQRA